MNILKEQDVTVLNKLALPHGSNFVILAKFLSSCMAQYTSGVAELCQLTSECTSGDLFGIITRDHETSLKPFQWTASGCCYLWHVSCLKFRGPPFSLKGGRVSGMNQKQIYIFSSCLVIKLLIFHFLTLFISTTSWRQLFISVVGRYKLFILPSSCLKLFI